MCVIKKQQDEKNEAINNELRPGKNGATAEIATIVFNCLKERYEIRSICIDGYVFVFCKGCRICHNTAKCIQHDDVGEVIAQYEWSDISISVSQSYWADIPGQFKAFIDRCTPWWDTHEPHASISKGKKDFSIALRTGPNMRECHQIIENIEHFYVHMKIECCGSLGLCSLEYREAMEHRKNEIIELYNTIWNGALLYVVWIHALAWDVQRHGEVGAALPIYMDSVASLVWSIVEKLPLSLKSRSWKIFTESSNRTSSPVT